LSRMYCAITCSNRRGVIRPYHCTGQNVRKELRPTKGSSSTDHASAKYGVGGILHCGSFQTVYQPACHMVNYLK
jgi:hypothetical protein